MSLTQTISDDMKEAMKTKNNATLSTLRLLRSAMKNKQIDVQHELSDEEIVAVIKSQMKQLVDSAVSFEAGGRPQMALSARAEIVVLERYVPAQMSDEALEQMIRKVIESTGAQSKQERGKVMGAAVKAVSGQADGARIKTFVERLLPVVVLVWVGVFASHVSFAAIDIVPIQLSSYSFLETGIRIFRVLLLWFGLLAVNMILHGGFTFMVASMRDNEHEKAWGEIAKGFIGSIAVVLLYSVATIMIDII